MPGAVAARRTAIRWPVILLAIVIALLVVHACGVLRDFWLALHTALALDYGEGIVWQQLALFGTPRAYSPSTALPFIVFHYPPLYYLLVQAAGPFAADPLQAGRLVAVLSACLLAPMAAMAVLLASGTASQATSRRRVAALLAGLFVLCGHPVHLWGMLMRVDMPGIVFGLAGLLVAMRAEGRFGGTLAALLLCTCAVFTKQTLLSYGMAVFVLSAIRRPRHACLAAVVAGGAGLAAVAGLQAMTNGGFLQHIVGYNINRYDALGPLRTFVLEGPNLLILALCTALAVRAAQRAGSWRQDSISWRRALLAVQFVLSSLTLLTLFKVGGNTNYLLDWSVGGIILAGVAAADPTTIPGTGRRLVPLLMVVLVAVALQPMSLLGDAITPEREAEASEAIGLIRSATAPVMSEDMTLLMQAGSFVPYEPAIATELAMVHRWDEAPLIDMINRHGFALFITEGWDMLESSRYTPGIKAAISQAYPVTRRLGPNLVVHAPGL